MSETLTPNEKERMTVVDDAPGTAERPTYRLDQLAWLESEAIHIIREVAAEFERPVLLFSGGKDSVVMLHLATKAFWPAPVPFPVMHVDTGHNFPEVLAFRDATVERLGLRLVVASVQDYLDDGRLRERSDGTRNQLQTQPLLDGITDHKFDAVFGGGRRDEEKARAKERVFSLRDEFGQWDPRNQRPELWNLYNGRHRPGEHVRVFPLSNWTELDVWQYIAAEGIELPPLYYAHERDVFERDGMLVAVTDVSQPRPGESVERRLVRYRTVGDMSCTGAVESDAATVEDVVVEVPTKALSEVPAERSLRFLGRPGTGVYQLPQAVLGKHVHGDIDPHLWHDVRNVMAYVQLVRDTLVDVDPAGASVYRARTRDYLRELDRLDATMRRAVGSIPTSRRHLVTSHDAFGYLAKAYGLKVSGFVTPHPGIEPSLADRRRLARTIADLDVPAVFLEPNLRARSSTLVDVAREQHVKVCPLYGDAFDATVRSYAQLVRHNARSLVQCLAPQENP